MLGKILPFLKKKTAPAQSTDEVISVEYSSLDACICCGKYMVEGAGMVCEECMSKFANNSPIDGKTS